MPAAPHIRNTCLVNRVCHSATLSRRRYMLRTAMPPRACRIEWHRPCMLRILGVQLRRRSAMNLDLTFRTGEATVLAAPGQVTDAMPEILLGRVDCVFR